MADNSDDRRNPDHKVMSPDRSEHSNEDILELSEMTVGISPEDEAIIDLTEEIVGGAFDGYSGLTGIIGEEEQMLDLSGKDVYDSNAPLSAPAGKTPETDMNLAGPLSAIENDIAQELDNYFQVEEETQNLLRESSPGKNPADGNDTIPVTVTSDQFDAALEQVVRKVFGDKIDRILSEVIERTVADEIDILKEMLVARGAKQD